MGGKSVNEENGEEMARVIWDALKHSKHFYVTTYRLTASVLIISSLCNVLLLIIVYYLYFSRPSPDYYATNGVTPPLKLNPMTKPNYKSNSLLEDEQDIPNENKVIPQ